MPVYWLASHRQPVYSKQVAVQEAVREVTTGFTKKLDLVDPRLNCFGHIDVRLAILYQGYTPKQDPPPLRVKPIPFPLLHEVSTVLPYWLPGDSLSLAMADMSTLASSTSYALPGEYCLSSTSSTPSRFCDVPFFSSSPQWQQCPEEAHDMLLRHFGPHDLCPARVH
jgi:hypothetical protein